MELLLVTSAVAGRLLLFDGASSRVLVERALDKSGVAGRHRLESFVK